MIYQGVSLLITAPETFVEDDFDFAGVLFVTNLAPRQNLLLVSYSYKGAADPLSADSKVIDRLLVPM